MSTTYSLIINHKTPIVIPMRGAIDLKPTDQMSLFEIDLFTLPFKNEKELLEDLYQRKLLPSKEGKAYIRFKKRNNVQILDVVYQDTKLMEWAKIAYQKKQQGYIGDKLIVPDEILKKDQYYDTFLTYLEKNESYLDLLHSAHIDLSLKQHIKAYHLLFTQKTMLAQKELAKVKQDLAYTLRQYEILREARIWEKEYNQKRGIENG